jgi:hypothetical protein
MLDPINEDFFLLVVDSINNSVIARSQAISVLGCEFQTTCWAWIFTQ